MKFLVTGAGGQLGQEWVQYLKEKKIPYNAFLSSKLDITIAKDVNQKIEEVKPDVVVNCAAYTDVDGAESEPDRAFLVNETAIENLTIACEAANAKLVHYSTDFVFSGSESDQQKYPEGYSEDVKTDPVNVYGESKAAGEMVLMDADCEWLLIRVSWLCGAFGNNFLRTMLRLGSDRDLLRVVDDQIGCPSFAFDVVEKSVELLRKKLTGTFHINCDGRISWADFAEEIFQQAEMKVRIKRITSDEYPFTAKRPMFTLLSNQKLKETGLDPLHWKVGLNELLKQINKKKHR